MEAVLFENVSFSYAGSDRIILDGVNLSVGESEFALLIGESGCGKSTLLRQIKKSITPYGKMSGRVLVFGEDAQEMEDRKSVSTIGYVHQDPDAGIVTDKVWHELAFGLESLGLSNSTIKRRVGEMASFFGIQNWFRKSTDSLSGGQKQLLNLASVMVMQPKLLVLDEPTAQLDPIAAGDFIRTLYRINREFGTAILISEHRLEELFPIADKVIVMGENKILSMESPRETAKKIGSTDRSNPLFLGLPTAARIYAMADKKEGDIPLSVREGRLWLAGKKEFRYVREKREISKDSVLELKDVWFRYQRNLSDVLNGLDFKLPKRAFCTLLGGNGAGKSTLLKIIGGGIKPYRGKLKSDKDLKIYMLPQDPKALFTEVTVEEEMFCATEGLSKDSEARIRAAEEMCDKMELSELLSTHPYDLSGGEQQRLALGAILLRNPDVLLLDEPTKGLDAFFKDKLACMLKSLVKDGMTILAVSHDVEFCARYSDVCGLVFDGQVVAMDTPEVFFMDNRFYTTAANRIARDKFPGAILDTEVAACLNR